MGGLFKRYSRKLRGKPSARSKAAKSLVRNPSSSTSHINAAQTSHMPNVRAAGEIMG